ncbi:MAG: precorrin-6y C5,15-methyltransferase (decarboxylating) subunit CbiE [Planctomycetota bacterium]|nr:precorrin-6y C5,15-methyltransferase (decarboxylating) subunit CbiE [Planctomycetota bacterium]
MIYIIGIGDDGIAGLTNAALERIQSASLLLGPANLMSKAQQFKARKETIGGDLEKLATLLDKEADGDVVVLTGGDPLFYGTARFLCDRLGKDRFTVIPHVSSMQLAFARVKESWDEAYLTNLATQSLGKVLERIRTSEKIGLFTSDDVSPSDLAKALVDQGIDYFTIYVCENLGSPDERVTRGSPAELAKQKFSQLNVMVLIRKPGVPDRPAALVARRLFGNPDELFLQSKPKRGLLTSSEVRCVALSELELADDSIFWDVGAGSGSVAIEAASIARLGHAYAIEMDAEDYGLLVENTQRFGVRNLTPILGQAPTAWLKLPDPDAIFVGGTGRSVTELVEAAWPRLRPGGRLIVNLASMENLVALQKLLTENQNCEPHLWMVQISRGNYQFEKLRLESANPTFVVKATKPHTNKASVEKS